MGKSLICLLFLVSLSTFAYTSIDISNAEFLTNRGIINKQNDIESYRLDDTITRAEVIKIALTIKGTANPTSYTCKKYFSDTTVNDWVCRAVEVAADAGFVSRTNKKFRPQDKITRAEALLVLTKAGGIYEKISQSELPYTFDTDIAWQQELLRGSFGSTLFFVDDFRNTSQTVEPNEFGFCPGMICTRTTIYFYPNRTATRAEIFDFVRNILEYKIKNPLEQPKQPISHERDIFYNNKTYNYSFYYPDHLNLRLDNLDSPFTTSIDELNNGFLIEKSPTGENGTSRSGNFSVLKVSSSILVYEWWDLIENRYSYFDLCAEDKIKSFEAFVNLLGTSYWKVYFGDKGGCEGSQKDSFKGPVYYFKVASRNDAVIKLNQGQLSNEEFKIILDSFKFQ